MELVAQAEGVVVEEGQYVCVGDCVRVREPVRLRESVGEVERVRLTVPVRLGVEEVDLERVRVGEAEGLVLRVVAPLRVAKVAEGVMEGCEAELLAVVEGDWVAQEAEAEAE